MLVFALPSLYRNSLFNNTEVCDIYLLITTYSFTENADFQSVKLFIDKKLDHFGKNVVWRIKNNNRSKRSLSDTSTLAGKSLKS